MVDSSDKMWSTGEGNGTPLQYCPENPMNSMKRQKDIILEDEFPRSVGAQHTTGEEGRNSSGKNEDIEPKPKNTQWWMSLMMGVKSNAVKNNIA